MDTGTALEKENYCTGISAPIHQQQLSPPYLELLWTWNLCAQPAYDTRTHRAIHEAAKMNAKGNTHTRKKEENVPPLANRTFFFGAFFWFRGLSIIIISFVFIHTTDEKREQRIICNVNRARPHWNVTNRSIAIKSSKTAAATTRQEGKKCPVE